MTYPLVAQQGKEALGDHLLDVFVYIYDHLLGKRDPELLGIKSEAGEEDAAELLDDVISTMCWAHEAIFNNIEVKPKAVDAHTHPEVRNFKQRVRYIRKTW